VYKRQGYLARGPWPVGVWHMRGPLPAVGRTREHKTTPLIELVQAPSGPLLCAVGNTVLATMDLAVTKRQFLRAAPEDCFSMILVPSVDETAISDCI